LPVEGDGRGEDTGSVEEEV
jgi:hypothetical protein